MIFTRGTTYKLIDLTNTIHISGKQNSMVVITQLCELSGLDIQKWTFSLSQIYFDTKQELDTGLVAGELFGNPIETVAMFREGNCLLTERDSFIDIRLIVCGAVKQREPCVQVQDGIVVVDSSHPL